MQRTTAPQPISAPMATGLTCKSAVIELIMAAGASTPEPIMILPRKRKTSAARAFTGVAVVGASMAVIFLAAGVANGFTADLVWSPSCC